MIIDTLRIVLLFTLLLLYAVLCFAIWVGEKRKHEINPDFINAGGDGGATNWLLVYASQTGTAEELAHQTAHTLQVVGVSAHVIQLSALTSDSLKSAERILFFISTYGEGDAPDNGAAFVSCVMGDKIALGHLHYALLALGDSTYAHHCGFGREVDAWLQANGALPLFDCVEVDRMNEAALSSWQKQLNHHIGTTDISDWNAPAFGEWTLLARR